MKIQLFATALFMVAVTLFSSCSAIASIFKAGMSVGAIGVILVIVLIIGLIIKMLSGGNSK